LKRPLNIAHRGGAGLWPENTLTAVREAARAGFDGAELDVQLTRDGRLVAFHDFIPNARTCRDLPQEALPVCEWTAAELRDLDVGAGEVSERIPLLEEVIAAVQQMRSDFLLFIELKTALHDRQLSATPETVAEAALSLLRTTRFEERAVLVGFDWAVLIHAKRIAPEMRPGSRRCRRKTR
jgi:glycerophosphoryl diester phosphodiesterase